MPPVGNDDRAYVLHVLSVVRAARDLAVAVARAGGHERVEKPAIQDELLALATEVGKLSVFENRAGVRGTIKPLTDEVLMDAVSALRAKPELTLDQEDVLGVTPEGVDDLFRLDPEPAPSEGDFSLEAP